jgi:hypothetical protein
MMLISVAVRYNGCDKWEVSNQWDGWQRKCKQTSEILQVQFQITAIKRVTRIIYFPNAYKSYVYTLL